LAKKYLELAMFFSDKYRSLTMQESGNKNKLSDQASAD